MISRKARYLPELRQPHVGAAGAAYEMANVILPFYYGEYVSAIDDAAEGVFTFYGHSARFPGPFDVDWHHTIPEESDLHLWRMKLNHMGFICPMLLSRERRHHDAVVEMIEGFRERADFGVPDCFSSYAFPYSASHRVLAILSGYILGDPSLADALRAEIASFLRWNAAFISMNVEHELGNNHVERNLAALCFYYSCAESVPASVAARLDREVCRTISECVLEDGLLAERSAMYQGLTVMCLGVFEKAPFLTADTRSLARDTRLKALRAWATMSHPDGEIALFNDSWLGEVPTVGEIARGAGAEPASALPDAGYVRLESDEVFLLMDAGPIGPRWNPGHGHADFLSVEVDVSGQRFIVDPGTFQYSTGPRRTFERSASSHNGPRRRGVEPVSYTGCFRVGRMGEARLGSISKESATGHLALPGGGAVSRTAEVAAGLVRIRDTWIAEGGGAEVRLTIADTWVLTSSGAKCTEFRGPGLLASIRILEGTISAIRPGEWSDRYLSSRPATVLTLVPEAVSSGGARLVWEIRKQGY